MEATDKERPSLQSVVEAAYNETVGEVETPPLKDEARSEVVADKPDAPEKTEGRTAGRERDAKGRLMPGGKEKAVEKIEKEPAQAEPAAPITPAVRYPDTWKKDLVPHWEKLDPQVQAEIARREADYSKGIHTYKTEWERARPLLDAITPFHATIQQSGLKPEQFVSALAGVHQTLSTGSPQEKLQAFARFANDYQIPLQELFIQGEDGKVYFNQQYSNPQKPAPQQGLTREDVDKRVAEQVTRFQVQQAISDFVNAKDASGQPLYPHFEKVKVSMDGLLRSGLEKDLPSAYRSALRLPAHSDLFEAEQKQLRAAEQQKELQKIDTQTQRAKRDTVSSRSSAPAGAVKTDKTRKGLHSTVEDAFETVFGGDRV